MTEGSSGEEADPRAFLTALAAMRAEAPESARGRDLLWFVLSYALLRRPWEEHEALIEAARQSQREARHGEEVAEMMASVGVVWEQDLLTRGEARGEINARREDLRLLLEERFGPLPEPLAEQIAAVEDAERLRNALRQAVHVSSLEELKL